MKKLKNLFLTVALMLVGITAASAQTTTDVTSLIINPNITGQSAKNNIPDGWTAGLRAVGNSNYTEGTGDTQLEAWKGESMMFFDYYQDIDLENGVYTLSAKCHDTGTTGAYLYVLSDGEMEKTFMPSDYAVITTPKILVTNGKLRIGMKLDMGIKGSWCTGDDFKLTKYTDLSLPDYVGIYNNLVTYCNTFLANPISNDTRSAIVTTLESTPDLSTQSNVETAIQSLRNNLESEYNSVQTIKSSLACKDANGWTNSPTLNTWSTENDSYGALMKVPFLQTWVAKNSGSLSNNTFEYTIDNLTAGEYEVSLLARALREAGTSGVTLSGATFDANGSTVDLTSGDACTNGIYGSYSTKAKVDAEGGSLTLKVIVQGANFNWLAWKNITVKYIDPRGVQKQLKAVIDEANSYYNHSTDNEAGTAKAAYKAVIDDAQTKYKSAIIDDMNQAMEKLKTAYQTYALSGAMPQEGYPFDLTFTLVNPSFSNNNADGWDVIGELKFQKYGNAEYYMSNFDISQTVKNLPKAYYKLKVKAFQRPGAANTVIPNYVNAEDKADGTANVNAEIYVNSGSQLIKNAAYPMRTTALGGNESYKEVNGTTYYIPNNMQTAGMYFDAGYYENEIELICTTGEAKMGFRCTNGTGAAYWTIFDDFRLYMTKEIDLGAYQAVYRNEIAEANRAMSLYPNVKGKEYAELNALISATEPETKAGLESAAAAIKAATASYIAANDNWTRYAVAKVAADKAEVTYTDISTDAEKDNAAALTAANEMLVSAADAVKTVNTSGKTLGYEAGEWTLYLIQPSIIYINTLATEGVIDAGKVAAANADEIKNAVVAIKDWKANDTEVNAVCNGNFSIADLNTTGWNRTNSWGQFLTDCDANSASKTGYYNQSGSLQYGNSEYEAYKLTLKGNTAYELTFKYATFDGNNTNKSMKASVLNTDNAGLKEVEFGANANIYKNSGAFKTATAQFITGATGNYVLTLANEGNTVITDVKIMKAVATPATYNETDAFTEEGGYKTVTVNRSFAAGWNGMVLPFDFTVAEAKTVLGATDIKDFSDIAVNAGNGVTLKFADATEIKAGQPVMIKRDAACEATDFVFGDVWVPAPALQPVAKTNGEVTYTFTATYDNTTISGETFTLILGNYFWNYDADETLSAKTFRAYFRNDSPISESKVVSMLFGDDTTGISEATTISNGNGKVYDMQGRRVENPAKGLYIQNGKKVVIK